MTGPYVIGIDFGTLSARALLMDAVSGEEICESVYPYPHGVMDRLPNGQPLPSDYALQHPKDYLLALEHSIKGVLQKSDIQAERIVGIGIDFTTCTLLPLDEEGQPLCFRDEFENAPHAYVKLWKHHSAAGCAYTLNQTAAKYAPDMLRRYGGKLSCEWVFPKILEILNEDSHAFFSANRFAEAGDWLTSLLVGSEIRSLSFAGYKACYDTQAGYPDEKFLVQADPRLRGVIGGQLPSIVCPVGTEAGKLSPFGARLTGLLPGTSVAVPMPDAHVAMPALGITAPGTLMLILGTSACHMLHNDKATEVPGVCGCVKDGVIPGLFTYEAGQPSCGDMLEEFIQKYTPRLYHEEAMREKITLHQLLTKKASALQPGESGLISLEWMNGNRSILNDGHLSGMILGLTLETKPEEIYRTLIEGIAFGTRTIVENFRTHGVDVNKIVSTGGIAGKNPMIMQILADVLNMPIHVSDSAQSSARGSALYAAAAAGVFPDITSAANALATPFSTTYLPDSSNVRIYDRLYRYYESLHTYFGSHTPLMHQLRDLRKEVKSNL